MKYSVLDLKSVYNKDTESFDVYFQNKFVMTVEHKGEPNMSSPRLVCHPSHTINEYLPQPYITAGGYNNSDLYDINGNKITDFKFWSIIESPIIYDNVEYFKVRTPKNKSGIINNKGKVVIPFEYDQDLNLVAFIDICSNGRLYVKKENKYGVIDINNTIVTPFTDSWHETRVQQLHDLGLWDDSKYTVIGGKLYDQKYAPKN